MRLRGLEPPRGCPQMFLRHSCIPFHHKRGLLQLIAGIAAIFLFPDDRSAEFRQSYAPKVGGVLLPKALFVLSTVWSEAITAQ